MEQLGMFFTLNLITEFFSHLNVLPMPNLIFLVDLNNFLLIICSIGEHNFHFSCQEILFVITSSIAFGISLFIGDHLFKITKDERVGDSKTKDKTKSLVGKSGKIKSIDGASFISIEKKLYEYESADAGRKILGKTYVILNVKEDKVII